MSRANKIRGLAALLGAVLLMGRASAGDVVVIDDDDGYVTVDGAAFVDPDVAVVDGDGVSYFVENDDLVTYSEVVGDPVRLRYFAPTATTRVVRSFAPVTTTKVVRSFAPVTTTKVVRSFAPVTSHKVVKVRSFAPAVDVIEGDTTVVVDRPVVIRKKTTIIEH